MIQTLKTDFWSLEMCDIQHYNEVLQKCSNLQFLFSSQCVSRPVSLVLTLTGLRDIDINWFGDILVVVENEMCASFPFYCAAAGELRMKLCLSGSSLDVGSLGFWV